MADETMTRQQESLLMFLETCLVDHAGQVCVAHMNAEDLDQAGVWYHIGLIRFGRLPVAQVSGKKNSRGIRTSTHHVEFSDDAWRMAHRFRRERAARVAKAAEAAKEAPCG